MSVSLLFPNSLVRVPAWEWRAGQGFCRFPGLDSTEAERLSGESRLPLLLGFSKQCLDEIYTTSKAIKRKPMNRSTKDEIEGGVQEAKGSVKEKAGQVTNRPALAAEGNAEKIAGKAQKEVGQIEEVLEK